jgi:hypothetical protein
VPYGIGRCQERYRRNMRRARTAPGPSPT